MKDKVVLALHESWRLEATRAIVLQESHKNAPDQLAEALCQVFSFWGVWGVLRQRVVDNQCLVDIMDNAEYFIRNIETIWSMKTCTPELAALQ